MTDETAQTEDCYRPATKPKRPRKRIPRDQQRAMAAARAQKPVRDRHNGETHGMNTLLRGVRRLEARGGKLLDRRTAVGKALAAWRASVIEDLGGAEAVSTTQMALIDIAVRSKLVLDSVDAFLLSGRRLANAKRRTVYPVVMQRAQLADGLARTLGQIGLERKARPLPSLAEYLAQRKAEQGREPAQVEEASEA